MTIREATTYSTQQLGDLYDSSEAAIISDWLIEHITNTKKTDRISYGKQELTEEQSEKFTACLNRLLENEPIQYVLNEAWFCGLKLYVDKNVLIPRPETEELVEWIITGCRFPINELNILDIGTGSGCIPIALKRRLGKSEVWSCDASKEALEVAKKNATNLGVDVNLSEIDFLSKQRDTLPSFDIIVSNPPYVTHKERYSMRPNVLEYEPAKALFVPDNDPLVFYRAIAEFGKQHLNPNGKIYMEINENLGHLTSQLFKENGYQTELKKDMQGKDRMLLTSLQPQP